MKKSLGFFFSMLLMILIVIGCSGDNGETSPGTDNTGDGSNVGTEDTESRTLSIAIGADLVSFDVHNHQTTSTEQVHMNMFSYLVKNHDGEFVPDLAESWELQEDQVTWLFKLKEGITFHNGDPLTAEDVKYSLERVATDTSLRSHNDYNQIKEVVVLSEYEFEIITHEPIPILLNRISRQASGILPKAYIEENGWDHFQENPIGTGPFEFEEWRRDEYITLTAYEDYFDGRIEDWDKVVFRIISEDSTRVAELLTGGVDVAENISPSDWERVNDANGTSIVTGPSNRTMMFFLRTGEEYPTSDVRVRQAIDYAIDNGVIVDALLKGGGTPSLTRVNPGNFGANEELFGKFNYDPEKARDLLSEAGFADGFEMTIHSPSGRYLMDRETLEIVSAMLTEVGIKVNMEFMEWGSFVDLRQAENHKDGYLIGLGASLFDSAQSLEYYGTARTDSINQYYNEEIEGLLEKAAVNMDPESRLQQYQRIQEIAAEEVPIITLFQVDSFYGINDRIDFEPRLDEMLWIPSITKK